MTENNLTSQVIDNVYKNAHIALQSISNVLPEAEDGTLKRELHAQYEGYEKFIGELSKFMHDNGFEPKDVKRKTLHFQHHTDIRTSSGIFPGCSFHQVLFR